MATSIGQVAETQSITIVCGVCEDESKKPKLLPCQHSFCTECLVKHMDTLEEGVSLCCPTCHKDITLGGDTVESLPDNYVYDIVKEAFGRIEPTDIKCMSCEQIEKVKNATHKCLDCSDTLCQSCNEYHCRTSMTKHHVVVSLENLIAGDFKEALSARKKLFCDIHSSKEQRVPLSSYCEKCQCLVCVTCTHSDHKGHQFTGLREAREEREMNTSNDFKRLLTSEKVQQERLENINNCIANTKRIWDEQVTEMYNTANQIYAMVDKIKEEKLAEMTSHYEKELQSLHDLLAEETCKRSSLQATVAFNQAFIDHSSDSDFLLKEKDVQTRVEYTQKKENRVFKRNILSIEKEHVDTIANVVEKVFGTLNRKERILWNKCRIGEINKRFSEKVKMGTICGIAYNSESKELVLTGRSSHESLLVLNDDGTFKRYIECEKANGSFDVCIQGHIYVTVFVPKSRQLFIIDEGKAITKSIKLPEDEQFSKYTIGVVVDGNKNVFLASDISHRIYQLRPDENTLSVFLSKEKGSDVNSPTYLCMMPSGELVVSSYGLSTIQVFSKEGHLLWTYDGKTEGNPLNNPGGICCDEDGYIYVADSKNCRIQVLRNKEWMANIAIDEKCKDSMFVPLCLTPDGDLIYGYDNNLVKISFWDS